MVSHHPEIPLMVSAPVAPTREEMCKVFPSGNVFTKWTKEDINALSPSAYKTFVAAVDPVALESATAQNLNTGISTVGRLKISDYTMYILMDTTEMKVLGLCKIGEKHLYMVDPDGDMKEFDLTCLLDFYIRKSHQRHGFGVSLFKYMLEDQKKSAAEIAYDRPSEKLYPFLAKHFDLQIYTPQPNRYVLYHNYWGKEAVYKGPGGKALERLHKRNASTAGLPTLHDEKLT